MRIAQLANLYSPVSGGLRTAVDVLGRGYAAAGIDRVLIVPGRSLSFMDSEAGVIVRVPGTPVGSSYRLVLHPRPVLRLLDRLRPDSIEVSDKTTLTVAAAWARRNGSRSVLFSHERLDSILAPRLTRRRTLESLTDWWNKRLAHAFDAVVTTSAFAAAEFERVGAPSLHRVALGVDLDTFRPVDRAEPPPGSTVNLVHVGRLSAEKRPELALAATRILHARGMGVRLHVVGDGPRRRHLEELARRDRLPVAFHGHVSSRVELAKLIAHADIALAPCPVESFCLTILEALATGTPVVTTDRGAAPELLRPGVGIAVSPTPTALAHGVGQLLDLPFQQRRTAARRQAERYPWHTTISQMLTIHTVHTGHNKPIPA